MPMSEGSPSSEAIKTSNGIVALHLVSSTTLSSCQS